MLAKDSAEKFFTGAFGKIYTRSMVDYLEAMREETGAETATQKASFDFDAKEGETVIEVSLTLHVKSEDDE